MGSAPHQGACADLNRGCVCGLVVDLRRACSCSVRVSSSSCGVHCASTSNVLRRASTGTNVLGASACSLCRTYFTAIGAFGSLPVEPTVCTCTCGRLHCVNTSSVRGTCTCHGVHRVAPAVYVTSAPVVESTRRLPHIRCTCACRGVHHVSTISVLRRASTGTVYFVPAPVSYATYCDCNRWLRFSPCRAHRLHLHLWWMYIATATIGIRGTFTCRGLHRPSTISVCYTAPASSVNVSPSPIVEHIAPTQAMSYAEEFYESSSHVRPRLLATRCGEQCSPVSLFVDTFHSCYKVSITKLTHRQLLCSPRTVGNVLALTWKLKKKKKKKTSRQG